MTRKTASGIDKQRHGQVVRSDAPVHLYIDEDSQSRSLVTGLRARGIDVQTSADASMNSVSDESQLAYATSQERALFTFNVGDFCRLHAEWMNAGRLHYGIVTCDQLQFAMGERLKRLLAFVEQNDRDRLRNRLEFLANWQPSDA